MKTKSNIQFANKQKNNKSTANRKTSVTNKTRSQTPLQKKKIYLDLPTSAATSTLEKNLTILGAIIEKCFSKEIDSLVTNRGRPSDYKHGGRKSVSAGDSGNSPATPSPFSPGVVGSLTSPSVDSPSSATTHKPLTRGKSLLQAARTTKCYGTSDVLESARVWNIRIVHLDAVDKWVKKELLKLPPTLRSGKSSKDKGKKNLQRGHTVTKLTGAYIKFEDIGNHYKPHYQEFTEFSKPCLQPLSNKCLNKCPFDITQPTQTGKPDVGLQLQRLGFPGSRKISSAKTAGTLPRKERDGYTIEDEVDPTHCGDRITRNNVKQTAKQCGYCEICGVKYDNLAKHVLLPSHREFSCNKDNFAVVDNVIDNGLSLESFVQALTLAHNSPFYRSPRRSRQANGVAKLPVSKESPRAIRYKQRHPPTAVRKTCDNTTLKKPSKCDKTTDAVKVKTGISSPVKPASKTLKSCNNVTPKRQTAVPNVEDSSGRVLRTTPARQCARSTARIAAEAKRIEQEKSQDCAGAQSMSDPPANNDAQTEMKSKELDDCVINNHSVIIIPIDSHDEHSVGNDSEAVKSQTTPLKAPNLHTSDSKGKGVRKKLISDITPHTEMEKNVNSSSDNRKSVTENLENSVANFSVSEPANVNKQGVSEAGKVRKEDSISDSHTCTSPKKLSSWQKMLPMPLRSSPRKKHKSENSVANFLVSEHATTSSLSEACRQEPIPDSHTYTSPKKLSSKQKMSVPLRSSPRKKLKVVDYSGNGEHLIQDEIGGQITDHKNVLHQQVEDILAILDNDLEAKCESEVTNAVHTLESCPVYTVDAGETSNSVSTNNVDKPVKAHKLSLRKCTRVTEVANSEPILITSTASSAVSSAVSSTVSSATECEDSCVDNVKPLRTRRKRNKKAHQDRERECDRTPAKDNSLSINDSSILESDTSLKYLSKEEHDSSTPKLRCRRSCNMLSAGKNRPILPTNVNSNDSMIEHETSVVCDNSKSFLQCGVLVTPTTTRHVRTVTLDKSWSVASDRSMRRLLMPCSNSSEDFHGFTGGSVSTLPTDISYDDVSHVDVSLHSDYSWVVNGGDTEVLKVIDNKEVTEGKRVQVSSPRKSPRKSVQKSPRKRNLLSRKTKVIDGGCDEGCSNDVNSLTKNEKQVNLELSAKENILSSPLTSSQSADNSTLRDKIQNKRAHSMSAGLNIPKSITYSCFDGQVEPNPKRFFKFTSRVKKTFTFNYISPKASKGEKSKLSLKKKVAQVSISDGHTTAPASDSCVKIGKSEGSKLSLKRRNPPATLNPRRIAGDSITPVHKVSSIYKKQYSPLKRSNEKSPKKITRRQKKLRLADPYNSDF